jgi:uncharacterized membrane protein YhiD involved in acid resistance
METVTSMWNDLQPGQTMLQLSELGLAFALSATIGLEREIRHKSAGLRTHTLVGFGAALFMLGLSPYRAALAVVAMDSLAAAGPISRW